jgi:protein ImuB
MQAELDRACGHAPEAHAWFAPPAVFCARRELPVRADTMEALLPPARRLLMQMTGWLAARHAAVSRFCLELHHEAMRRERQAATTVAIALGSASRDLAHLALLLRERLARVALAAPVTELCLRAEDIVPLAAPNSELFPAPLNQTESMGRLIERLASRLGGAAVSRLAIAGDHRPERCSVAFPAQDVSDRLRQQSDRLSEAFPARPAWLLRQPLSLSIRHDKPFYQSPLTLLAGPERIEAGWWDDEPAARDYFIACNDVHLLLWIYRERPSAGQTEPGWFLHGFFG